MSEKIKVLWYSDFMKHTGFGNVAEAILERLNKTGDYEFQVVGINFDGSPYNYPANEYFKFKDIPIWPAASPLYEDNILGHRRMIQFLGKQKFDLLFILQDSFNIVPLRDAINRSRIENNFRYIFYFPVDGDLHNNWVSDAVQIADFPVTYSQFGFDKIKEMSPALGLKVINHGVDLNVFKPMESEEARAEFRRSYFNADADDFIIANVNRNQPRKDLPRCMMAFGEFCKRYPEIKAKLYLHCHPADPAGHKIHEIARKYLNTMALNKIISPDPILLGNNGIPVDKMAQIYAGADILTSTTLGEGWGLSTTEAMACKTPVVMPNNSALTEIIGANNERGYLVKSGGTPNHMQLFRNDLEIFRPLTDIEDLIATWKHVYDNREEAKLKAEEAFKWVQNISWDIIAKQWDELFKTAYASRQSI